MLHASVSTSSGVLIQFHIQPTELKVHFTQTGAGEGLSVQRRTAEVLMSFILFLLSLNKACFKIIKSAFLWMESGGLDEDDMSETSEFFNINICY